MVLIALLTCALVTKACPGISTDREYESLDGLRGLLSISVYLHHSEIWYTYIKTGIWASAQGNFFAYLGTGSVMIFFMISGFLFINKILLSNEIIDWNAFFVSRILRIAPAYYLAATSIFILVYIKTSGKLNTDLFILFKQIFKWICLGFFGTPDLNGLKDTWVINAGVLWSLSFEWCFYFLLPLIAFLINRKKISIFIVISCLSAYQLLKITPDFTILLPFLLGGITAKINLMKLPRLQKRKVDNFLLIILMLFLCILNVSPTSFIGISLMWIIFSLIVIHGSSIGWLKNSTFRLLGDISYSLYLIHGIILYVTFEFVIGLDVASKFTLFQHWGVIILSAPIIVGFSLLSYKIVELPCINASPKLSRVISCRIGNLKSIFISKSTNF